MSHIRVSASSLARIKLGAEYLVVLHKIGLETGKKRFAPLGGVIQFHEGAREFLEGLEAKFEEGNDLRLELPKKYLSEFVDWIKRKDNRETSPHRELKEELVDEIGILPKLPESAVSFKYVKREIWGSDKGDPTERHGHEGEVTYRIFEIYKTIFSQEYREMLRFGYKNSNKLALVDRFEIERGKTRRRYRKRSSIEISPATRLLLK